MRDDIKKSLATLKIKCGEFLLSYPSFLCYAESVNSVNNSYQWNSVLFYFYGSKNNFTVWSLSARTSEAIPNNDIDNGNVGNVQRR